MVRAGLIATIQNPRPIAFKIVLKKRGMILSRAAMVAKDSRACGAVRG